MKLKKKELIISVIMLIVFLVAGLNLAVLATSDDGSQNILFPPANNSLNNNLNIITPGNNTTDDENTGNSINIPIKDGELNENTNTPTKVPNTGLEDLPWVIIGICAVSAIFAYKKIKEYKED